MTESTTHAGPVGHEERTERDVRKNVEDVLPLLPNQQALVLFKELQPDSDPGFLQVTFTLTGSLDLDAYQAAWREVMRWHPALRSSIRGRKDGDPLMVVWREVDLRIDVVDWQRLDAADQSAHRSALLAGDSQQGIDLQLQPTMRLTIVQISPTHTEVVWTCHHLFTDGWSSAIVLEDVMAVYSALQNPALAERRLPPDRAGLRQYHAWASTAASSDMEDYWADRFHGCSKSPPLYLGQLQPNREGHGELTVDITEDVAQRVKALALDLKVTTNTVLQAAWSLVLSAIFGSEDVVYGTTVSGRTAPVDGMERLVGYFSNAVPIRTRITREMNTGSWLQQLRDEQFAMQPFEHATLADVQGWSGMSGGRQIFDSFLVVENFPMQPNTDSGIALSGFRSGLTTAFPLTVAFGLGEPWFVHLRYARDRCTDDAAEMIVDQLLRTLAAIAQSSDQAVGTVLEATGVGVGSVLRAGPHEDSTTERHIARGPQSPVEETLMALWRDELGLAVVSVDDNFFDLGGTSLGAVRLFARIEETFGRSLPLHTLLASPTIASLASALDPSSPVASPEHTCLVPVQALGTQTPIIGVHGGGGEILFYRTLAERLGPDQPLYGIEPVGLDGAAEPLDTVHEMAARYVDDVRALRPSGPYRLMGYCFGGAVALEMASILEGDGELVEFVVVIDGGLPLEAARASNLVDRAKAVYKTRGVANTAKAAIDRLANRGQLLWDGSFGGVEGRERAKYGKVAQACRRAFSSYEPAPSSAPIILIRSRELQTAEGGDWHTGWDAYTSRFDIRTIDASHLELFEEPAIDELAAIVREQTGNM